MSNTKGRGESWGEEVGGVGADVSGVDGDDLPAASAYQEDPVQTLSEDFQELHVWGGGLKKIVTEI